MVAETAQQFEALEAQAATLMELFSGAGYEAVAPAMIQPARVYLDRLGEEIRGRTYLFTDLHGEELCLRPDLTVPVCRLYLERHPAADTQERYCYNGPAFRYGVAGRIGGSAREFRQAGIELIGADDTIEAETEVVRLAIEAMAAVGLSDYQLKLGDLGLFEALIDALDMPERWRLRLWHAFWQPARFHDLLHQLAAGQGSGISEPTSALLAQLDPDDIDGAEQKVADYLEANGIPVIAQRTPREIAERLCERAADARQDSLPKEAVSLIEDFLAVEGPPGEAIDRIAALARDAGIDISSALDKFHAQLASFALHGIGLDEAEFDAEFGRNIEYYTGFVFQITCVVRGVSTWIAGGGRYDSLLSELGSPARVPAVGCAIHTERLLAAVLGGEND